MSHAYQIFPCDTILVWVAFLSHFDLSQKIINSVTFPCAINLERTYLTMGMVLCISHEYHMDVTCISDFSYQILLSKFTSMVSHGKI